MMAWLKRLSCAFASAMLALALVPFAGAVAYADETTIHIKTAEDLVELAKDCSLDSYSAGLTVELDASFSVEGTAFAGIPYFAGTFRGNNNVISGFSLEDEGSHLGFFRYVTEDGSVSNLTVKGTVQPKGECFAVGGIVGSNAGALLACHFEGAVAGATSVGGVAGENSGSLVSCSATGSVQGSHQIGGLAGSNDGTIMSCNNAALVNENAPMEAFQTASMDGLAALVGKVAGGSLSQEDVLNVTDVGGIAGSSTGIISFCTNGAGVGYQHVGYNVGGIVGRSNGIVDSCENKGAVLGRKDVGGIAGQLEPYTFWDLSSGKLDNLRGNLSSLSSTVGGLIYDARGSSSRLGASLQNLNAALGSASDELGSMAGVIGRDANTLFSTCRDLLDLVKDMSDSVDSDRVRALIKELEDLMANPESIQPTEVLRITREIMDACEGAFDKEHLDRLNAIAAAFSYEPLNFTGFFEAWGNALSALEEVRQEASATGSSLMGNISALSSRMSAVGSSAFDAAESLAEVNVDYRADVSDSDEAAETGVVAECANSAAVEGDTNVGGVVGAVAFDLAFDPEDNLSLANMLFTNARHVISAQVRACSNAGAVSVKKQAGGGIVGITAFGAVFDCVASGSVTSAAGGLVGGVAGDAQGVLLRDYARTNLKGSYSVGGVAGSAAAMKDCRAYVHIEGSGHAFGSIAGSLSGEAAGNYFVENGLGGIDGISYEGQAEALSFQEMMNLPDVPAAFSSVAVTFALPDGTQKVVDVAYGDALDASLVPVVAPKEGKVWRWNLPDVEKVLFSVTVEGEWGYPVTTLATAGEHPDFLVEGVFADGQKLTAQPVSQPDTVLAARLTVEGYDGNLTVRAHAADPCQVTVDGVAVEVQRDGSYAVFEAPNGATIAITAQKPFPWAIVAVCAAIVGAAAICIALRNRRKITAF